VGFDHLAKIFGNSGGENFGRETFAGQGCNMSGLLSQLSYKLVFTWYPAIIHVFRKNARGISPSAQTLARENAIIIYSYFTYGDSVVYY
jgi:hypothetical protein